MSEEHVSDDSGGRRGARGRSDRRSRRPCVRVESGRRGTRV